MKSETDSSAIPKTSNIRLFRFQERYRSDDEATDTNIGAGDSSEECLKIKIKEEPDSSYGRYVWFAAPVLAQFVWTNRDLMKNKKVLEIGAGTALPGIVAAKCGAEVIFSDSDFLPSCLNLCQDNIHINNIKGAKIIGLTWGLFSPGLLNLDGVDIILGSDCFYDPKDFEDILVTVSFILKHNPDGRFLCSYQERSSDWTIESLLLKWNFVCSYIPLESFGADTPHIAGSSLPGFHTIHLLDIRLKQSPSISKELCS